VTEEHNLPLLRGLTVTVEEAWTYLLCLSFLGK
jgi:hypothetical protein